ncbi:S-adenosylmethionine-dependentmethyltransferase [Clostridium bornimense]|uniref:S-adenosylmethionine-dependentmethyltransferase n=1 Tax=Clostridium bornimense TaxID=1216932 RepID=W6RYU8_9CLOT|nr:class I SAM-dependent methyltransferase [Clostridium bornimense]CDM69826.1 S-adenosylmethionine-dependentmethyltransferase [Clostridium bornimense]
MDSNLKNYLENIKKPWGILFYKVIWEQLSSISNCKVLDFGSGFGFTSNYLAAKNNVTAIEPNLEMIEERICENNYKQIYGDIKALKEQEDNSFDVILCHNVLEYAKERKEIFDEFYRILKPNGVLSIVKHNHAGRIMQKVVFENNVDEAISLLNGGKINVYSFGEINYYDIDDIKEWIGNKNIIIEKIRGVRTFWALQQNNEIKNEKSWQDKMFEIEMKVSDIEEFINISFFNHVLLRKIR